MTKVVVFKQKMESNVQFIVVCNKPAKLLWLPLCCYLQTYQQSKQGMRSLLSGCNGCTEQRNHSRSLIHNCTCLC